MTDEMDFELVIGPATIRFEDGTRITMPRPKKGVYYTDFNVIAVDQWDGTETEEAMADVLSHEFIHHLLKKMFGKGAGTALDNIRDVKEKEFQLINEKGIEEAWKTLSPRAKFALKCSILWVDDYECGNGVI